MSKKCAFILVLSSLFSGLSFAAPETGVVHITEVRPVTNASGEGFAIIVTDSVAACNTDHFKINFALPGGKEIYSTVLAALIANKPVNVELVDSGCVGWGTSVKSVSLRR
ncbi:hypothetical protein [Photobacterium chitinilyticum]|uniref:hypothetical protein n=1 Tax=Photobacterium chitinilyticum TaxID=2485123 RepID=UPI003D0BDCAE